MPQLQPGQVVPGQGEAPKLYGTDKQQNSIPFQEKLMQLFKPQEFVTIKNITDESVFWQYMPADNEQENFSEDGMQRIITRENPEMWFIPAGETEVLVGASAYRALDVIYKAWAASTVLKKYKDPNSQLYDEKGSHLPRNFNFADAGAQATFIEKAYLGKATPTFGSPVVSPTPIEAPSQAGIGTFATTQSAPSIQPMTATPPAPAVDDPTTPKPKTTEGAPLAPVTYAEPDGEVVDKAAKVAKETVNAGGKK